MRELDNLIRPGRVSSVDEKKHTAQVEFSEIDGLVTFDLSVLVTRPGDYSLPAPGSLVVCLMIPGTSGIGYVFGAIYSESDAPPLDDKGKRSIASDDLRLGDPAASDKVALAPATKTEIQKAVDYISNVVTVLSAAAPAVIDASAPLWAPVVAALSAIPAPVLVAPAAEKVSAK